MIRFTTVLLLACFSFGLQAQTAFDALRFSTLDVTATARNLGVGGTMGTLGADFSVLSTNPAGLGAYRTSEIMLSPAFTNIQSTSLLENDANAQEVMDSETKFLLSNVGIVFVSNPIASKWKNINFAFGLNQMNSFEQDFQLEGSSRGSIVDRFQELANDQFFSDFEDNLAIDAGALIFFEDTQDYGSDVELNPNANIFRAQSVMRSGSVQEFSLAIGGNYNEKFLVGMSIGVPVLRFTEDKVYREADRNREIPAFENLEFIEHLTTEGLGFNAKVGVTALLTQKLRVGLAVHTPSFYALRDSFTTDFIYTYNADEILDSELEGIQQDLAQSPIGEFDYGLRTPWRIIGGAGLIVGKSGFVSTELEVINFSSSRFNLVRNSTNPIDIENETQINNQIDSTYRTALNFRVGGELAVKVFRFRAGLGLGFSPNKAVEDVNRLVSFGIGYRKRRFFADAAFRTSITEGNYIPYQTADPSLQQSVNTEVADNRILLTVGYKF
ncbi:MAG: hypothetical protein AAF849_13040 [Bacteroidota bacterium]